MPGTAIAVDATRSSDRICVECELNMTFTSKINEFFCRNLTVCVAGERMGRLTKSGLLIDTDRQCVSCERRTFSTGLNSESCQEYTDCEHEELAPGTPTTDRRCSKPPPAAAESSPAGTIAGVVVALLAIAALAVVMYRKRKADGDGPGSESLGWTNPDGLSNGARVATTVNPTYAMTGPAPGAGSSDETFFERERRESSARVGGGQSIANASYAAVGDLDLYAGADGNWRDPSSEGAYVDLPAGDAQRWWAGKTPKAEVAAAVLTESSGCFLVRESSVPGQVVLTVNDNGKDAHFPIFVAEGKKASSRGTNLFTFGGDSYTSMEDLIQYLKVSLTDLFLPKTATV